MDRYRKYQHRICDVSCERDGQPFPFCDDGVEQELIIQQL
jgi:hypothetical protein